MKTVADMLDSKGREVWSITPDKSVYDAIVLMAEKEIGALTVTEGGKMVGIISERDCARKVILKDRMSAEIKVGEAMTGDVISVMLTSTVDDCMAAMSSHKIRHLPVLDADSLVGIVAVGDVLKFIIREQSEVIEELENYVKDETGGSG